MPNFLKPYFWDVEFASLELQRDKEFIISRLLEKGRLECISWLLKTYDNNVIYNTVKLKYNMSQETVNLTLALLS